LVYDYQHEQTLGEIVTYKGNLKTSVPWQTSQNYYIYLMVLQWEGAADNIYAA